MSCEGRFMAQVSFRWAPSAAGINASYLDVGTDANFAPGTFVARAQNPATSTYNWTGLQANVLTHFRINALTNDGRWMSSDLGGFYAECAPPVREGVIGSGDRLFVSRIGIDAPVNIRDIASDGIMGDPAGPLDVVRYNFPLSDGFDGYPGNSGTTLIAGHLDFRNYGLAVFGKLKEIVPGDAIDYLREDGVMVSYQVDWVEDVAPDYPFGALARTTAVDSLVLITCTGQFDWSVEEYPLRRVVYATKVTAPAQ
jgi:LPXTG-site transpeptidase (sortase) family protein